MFSLPCSKESMGEEGDGAGGRDDLFLFKEVLPSLPNFLKLKTKSALKTELKLDV